MQITTFTSNSGVDYRVSVSKDTGDYSSRNGGVFVQNRKNNLKTYHRPFADSCNWKITPNDVAVSADASILAVAYHCPVAQYAQHVYIFTLSDTGEPSETSTVKLANK